MGMIEVRMSVERLQAMSDNGLRLWATPGAHALYWAHDPSFSRDVGVGSVADFLAALGFDSFEGCDPDEIVSIEVVMPDGE